jgi:hypothetical protein
MRSLKFQKSLSILLLLVLCFSVSKAGLLGDLGSLLSGSSENLTKKALERLQREAAYKIIENSLYDAGVKGAKHFVDAIRALIEEEEDWGKAVAAFYTGLDKSGSEEARNVLKTLYGIAITVRLTNEKVSKELISLIEYVNENYHF